jgi:hypothetical protein
VNGALNLVNGENGGVNRENTYPRNHCLQMNKEKENKYATLRKRIGDAESKYKTAALDSGGIC